MLQGAPLVVNGWSIYAHPIFPDQREELIGEVEAQKRRNPKICSKRLAAIVKIATENIPADPGCPIFRQGKTLGPNRKHWFRAKFFQQYRLFFRFESKSRVIVLAWVNDGKTLRAHNSRTDAYAIFRAMLDGGNPPDSFDALRRAVEKASEGFKEGIESARGREYNA